MITARTFVILLVAGCGGSSDSNPPVEAGIDASTACATNDECPIGAPICREDKTCHTCELDDECASTVCRPDGACEPAENVLYASPSGVSAGTCGQTTPCDLAFARTKLTAQRSTIRLANGTYALASDFTITGAGATATIVGGRSAILQRSTPGAAIQATSGGSLVVRGITANRGFGCSSGTLDIRRVAFDGSTEVRPWILANSCTLTLVDSELNSSSAEGIIGTNNGGAQPTVTITSSIIKGSTGDGINLTSGKLTVTRTSITGGMQLAINVNSTETTVTRSLVTANRRGGISVLGSGRYEIINNFVFRNGNDADGQFGGLRLSTNAAGNRALHNTIAFNDCDPSANPAYAGGLYCTNGIASNNLVVNNFAGNATQPNAQFAGNCTTAGSIIANGAGPEKFVRPIAEPFDYHLADGTSSAANAGVTTDVSVDFDGQPRPNGQPDVGADELQP